MAALFPSSRDLPDDVLTFIKAHPLLDPAVPPAAHQPLLTLTSRYAAKNYCPTPRPSHSPSDLTRSVILVGGRTHERGVREVRRKV